MNFPLNIMLEEQAAEPALSIRARAKVEDLPTIIGQSYGKIAAYLTELGEQPKNVPFVVYYNMDMQDLDIEMGFPVHKPLPEKGDIKSVIIPAGKVATCMYKGAYSSMGVPYEAMGKWIEEKGLTPMNIAYEYYYNSPEAVAESELLTKIVMLVK